MTNVLLTTLNTRQALSFRAAGHWGDDSIYTYVARHAEKTPTAYAVRDRVRRVTYADLIDAADRLAASLHASGLLAGDRVAVWLPSRIETATAMLACSRNGYVCCPSLHRDHTTADIVSLLQRMRASALIAERGYGSDAERHDIFKQLDGLTTLKAVHPLEKLISATDAWLWPSLPGRASSRGDDPDSIIYLAFTSGTTGVPKGVMHSDNTLLANALTLSADWELGADACIYSMSPLSHNLGFGALIMTLARGGEFVIHDMARGESLIGRILETDASFLIGVPTHAIDLLAELRARGLSKLGRVKGMRVSGASIPPNVAEGLLAHGVVPQSGFGMTEAGSHHYTLPGDSAQRICETSGRACATYDVRIFAKDDPNLEVSPGDVGQICGRGASLMLGYFDDQDATESSFNASGWFITGDLGWVDADGYLRVTGRKKDVIIRGGHNIYPARIEALALRHADVLHAAAVAVDDDRLGEKVCLVVAPKPGHMIDVALMLEHLEDAGLSKYDMPEYFVTQSRLPLTASGKILKREILDSIKDGRVTPIPVRYQVKAAT